MLLRTHVCVCVCVCVNECVPELLKSWPAHKYSAAGQGLILGIIIHRVPHSSSSLAYWDCKLVSQQSRYTQIYRAHRKTALASGCTALTAN